METETPKTSPILDLAWKRAANFAAHSGRRKNGFYDARGWIAILGVLATFIAIVTQLKQSWLQDPKNEAIAIAIRILFVATPVVASMLAAIANKKYANGDWWMTRAAAEEIRKEVYYYSTVWPKADRDKMLEASLARIQRQVYRALGGVFALEEPKTTPRPLDFGDLTGDQYFQKRLMNQLTWHNDKVNQLKGERDRMTVLILAIGALGTVLATLSTGTFPSWGIWVALTASIASALIGWEQLRGNEATIRNYSKVVLELSILRDHWQNLSQEQKANPLEFQGLVNGCENVLWAQNTEYIKSMQDVLKDNNLEEQAKLATESLETTVASYQETTHSMQESTIRVVQQAANDTGEMVQGSYKETLDTLREDGSEVLQKQLDSASQAVTQAAENLVARMPNLTTVIGQIADEYSNVEVGQDTSKEQLNEILARYPKTGDVKG